MRFPSVSEALTRARSTAARFPFVLTVAVIAAGAALLAVDVPNDDEVIEVVFTALLGLSLLLAVALTAERRALPANMRTVLSVLALAVLAGLYLWARRWPEEMMVTRYLQAAVAFHLLAAVLPFAGAGSLRGFWQYNRIMFIRFLLATLYAAVLFAGLAIAMAAIDQLFDVNINGDWYLRLWIVLAFIFHPWFFLAGLPADLDALDQLDEYPGALKVFAQFVLVPLVTVYLLILTAYLVRVIVTTSWPSGWIGYLVSSVAAAGTLALLLVHPIREREDARWVDTYGRWFFVALLPSIGMLFMAIGLRLNQYGFTERRYFLLVLAIWLTGIALFYGITGSRDIRWIPITLCIVALLTFTGPWSAYAVSRRSQSDRLEDLLTRNGILGNGDLRPARDTVPREDAREVSATVRYLLTMHGPKSLARVHPALADTSARGLKADSIRADDGRTHAARVVARTGLPYLAQWQRAPDSRNSFFIDDLEPAVVDVRGFDLISTVDLTNQVSIPVASDSLVFTPLGQGNIAVRWRGALVGHVRIDSLVSALPAAMLDGTNRVVPDSLRTFDLANAAIRVRAIVRDLNGHYPHERRGLEIGRARVDVLIDVR